MEKTSLRLKIFFWVILGAFSTFFAEVVSGSEMFPFFNAWGLFVVFPLYTLHILVLAHIVFYYGKPRLYTLYIAGILFGLYEAYITKVLWIPPWNPTSLSIGGVAISEFIVLVLFWHALFAFIIPLFIGESILTKSRTMSYGLPLRVQRFFKNRKFFPVLAFFAIFFGLFQSVNSASYLHSLASGISTILVLSVLIYLWRNKTSGLEYDMKSLLPGKKAFVVLFILIIILYATLIPVLRAGFLPGIPEQATIWIAYIIALVLLIFSLKKSNKISIKNTFKERLKFSWKSIGVLAVLFTLTSTFSVLLLGNLTLFFLMLIAWPLIHAVGVILFILAVRDLVKK